MSVLSTRNDYKLIPLQKHDLYWHTFNDRNIFIEEISTLSIVQQVETTYPGASLSLTTVYEIKDQIGLPVRAWKIQTRMGKLEIDYGK